MLIHIVFNIFLYRQTLVNMDIKAVPTENKPKEQSLQITLTPKEAEKAAVVLLTGFLLLGLFVIAATLED